MVARIPFRRIPFACLHRHAGISTRCAGGYGTTVSSVALALQPGAFLRSIEASRATIGRPAVKLLDVISHVRTLTVDAPYAVIGGLAQILWARKTHTDDIDVALASADLASARERVESGAAGTSWSVPAPPNSAFEDDDVFQVFHAQHDGAVVDLIAFRDAAFNAEIIATAVAVAELDGARFVRPELLLVTQLLRPGPTGALAALELLIARRSHGGLDEDEVRRWAERLGRGERLRRVEAQAAVFEVM